MGSSVVLVGEINGKRNMKVTLFTDKERDTIVDAMKDAYDSEGWPVLKPLARTSSMRLALAVAETSIRNATLEEAAVTAENILELGDGCEVLPNQTGKYVAKLIRAMKKPTK